MTARVEKVVTSGVFALDGGTFAVDNNVWLVGDDREVLVVDPAHDPDLVLDAVGERKVTAVVCTHGHNDHINGAVALADKVGAPVLLHADDLELWQQVHAERPPDWTIADGELLTVAGTDLQVLHTPGHTWGSVCLHAAEQGWLFSGDTLFQGGPGATGRSYSDFTTIIRSITSRLLDLDGSTVVHTGHGPTTTIGAESPNLPDWIARGH
ncbi:MBL fold metallo-hydrolase [Saccharopolyspora erythraea]|uniref:MBL fold metallo-hydrolase n=1 Tax=Saccharopolyspora erythraea TaxID=1836 RepID=UPI001BAE508A|nr:MBL fold metallo-hydrolase [Saccharopolyspora erythraea]QUH03341.1 MBL fold metallo-hydrolase [Saccharopolyspora erythraea]